MIRFNSKNTFLKSNYIWLILFTIILIFLTCITSIIVTQVSPRTDIPLGPDGDNSWTIQSVSYGVPFTYITKLTVNNGFWSNYTITQSYIINYLGLMLNIIFNIFLSFIIVKILYKKFNKN